MVSTITPDALLHAAIAVDREAEQPTADTYRRAQLIVDALFAQCDQLMKAAGRAQTAWLNKLKPLRVAQPAFALPHAFARHDWLLPPLASPGPACQLAMQRGLERPALVCFAGAVVVPAPQALGAHASCWSQKCVLAYTESAAAERSAIKQCVEGLGAQTYMQVPTIVAHLAFVSALPASLLRAWDGDESERTSPKASYALAREASEALDDVAGRSDADSSGTGGGAVKGDPGSQTAPDGAHNVRAVAETGKAGPGTLTQQLRRAYGELSTCAQAQLGAAARAVGDARIILLAATPECPFPTFAKPSQLFYGLSAPPFAYSVEADTDKCLRQCTDFAVLASKVLEVRDVPTLDELREYLVTLKKTTATAPLSPEQRRVAIQLAKAAYEHVVRSQLSHPAEPVVVQGVCVPVLPTSALFAIDPHPRVDGLFESLADPAGLLCTVAPSCTAASTQARGQ